MYLPIYIIINVEFETIENNRNESKQTMIVTHCVLNGHTGGSRKYTETGTRIRCSAD